MRAGRRAAWSIVGAAAALATAACVANTPRMQPPVPILTSAPATGLAQLRGDAAALLPLVHASWVRDFLRATAALPSIEPRVVYQNAARTAAYTEEEAKRLPEAQRAKLERRTIDDAFYYTTKYGSPLAYARALDLVAREVPVARVEGDAILDFGYGGIGHLRLLASLGVRAVGVDVDPLLRAMYASPSDQGAVPGFDGHPSGSVRLVDGSFPADPRVRAAVGTGYDGVLSKNTLKRGYVHPAQPVDPRATIQLGVDDATFVRALADITKPGGFVMIYNLGPAPAPPGKPYVPYADLRCPFARALLEGAGFRVIAFDRDDTAAARAQGRALGWDRDPDDPIDLDHDLFAMYTLFVKR